jgi:hypothetical protein
VVTSTSAILTGCAASPQGGLVANPSFECGTYDPWQIQVQPGTTGKVSSRGFNDQFAFEFDQVSAIASGGFHFAQGRLLQAISPLNPSTTYTLSFATNITPSGAGFWGVIIDCQPLMTVDANDGKGPGVWNTWQTTFVATNTQMILTFEALASGPGNVFKIDNVNISPSA